MAKWRDVVPAVTVSTVVGPKGMELLADNSEFAGKVVSGGEEPQQGVLTERSCADVMREEASAFGVEISGLALQVLSEKERR